MKCEIIWNSLNLQEWETRFLQIERSNILQSYSYARAICPINKQSARWGLILIDGKEAGLVQLLEASILWRMFHALVLDRGPLWFDGYGGAAHIQSFFQEFNHQFPNRWGRKRRIIPEIEDSAAANQILKQAGLTPLETEQGYQTLWWDLNQDDERAMIALKSGWRGALKKAESADVIIEWNDNGKFYPWLRHQYAQDKKQRGYGGPSPKLLDNLAAISTPQSPMIIGKVRHDGRDIAGIMLLKHGNSATYQVGWTSEDGRKYNAHHLLLWQSRDILRQHGVRHLDLGGINDDTASGVKKFKIGTGASASWLIGHYM